jgi:ATP-dependent helicase/nuclease subunit B
VDTLAGTVLLRGKIDRVDRMTVAGQSGLLAVDYKTGRVSSNKDIDEGRDLQLPVYVEALEQILGGPVLGGAFHSTRNASRTFFASVNLYRGQYKEQEDFPARRAAAVETIGRYVSAIRAGVFDALPAWKCPSYCPYGQICHHSEARVRRKRAAGTEDGQ